MEHVAGEVHDLPDRQTGRGTTTTGELEAGIARDAELPVTVDHRALVIRSVETVEVTGVEDGVATGLVDVRGVVAPVQVDVVVQVQDVARAVARTGSVTGREEARSVVRRGVGIVVEGSAVRAAAGHTGSGDTEDTKSVVIRLVVEHLTGVVVDDLPLLLSRVGSASELEHVAVRGGEAEEVITLGTGIHRELGIVEATGGHSRAIAGRQRVGRAVPSVTKGVEHHELHEGLTVGAAREDTASIVHRGIAVEVEGRCIGTSADLSGVAVVEINGATVLVLSDDVTGVHIVHGPRDLTQEASATGGDLEASIVRNTEGVLPEVRASSRTTASDDGGIEGSGGNHRSAHDNLIDVAVPTVTPVVGHLDKDHGLGSIRALVVETGAIVKRGVHVIVQGCRIRATRDIADERERERRTAAGHRSATLTRAVERGRVERPRGASISEDVVNLHRVVTSAERGDAEVGGAACSVGPQHRVVRDVKNGVAVEGDNTSCDLFRPGVGREGDGLRLERRKEGQCERRKSTSENGSSQVHD